MRGGYQVTLASRKFSLGTLKYAHAQNISTVIVDWNDKASLLSACKNQSVVIHLAGPSAFECKLNPQKAHVFGGEGTKNIISAAGSSGVRRFIYVSTIHVYSELFSGTITEQCKPLNTQPYAMRHRLAELEIQERTGIDEMEFLIARTSNVFGAPPIFSSSFVELFVHNACFDAVNHGRIKITGNPGARRDFLTLTSFCKTLALLVEKTEIPHGELVFHVASGVSLTLKSMALLIKKRAGRKLRKTIMVDCLTPYDKTPKFNFDLTKSAPFGLAKTNECANEIDALIDFFRK